MSDSFDVIVIGGGPAGYPAAIRAAQNKLSVACIDGWKNLDGSYAFGGTCLNAGCIPSKALLESSELYHRAAHEFKTHGIGVGALTVDVAAMQKRKAGIVKGMTGGIASLLKAAGVTALQGRGQLLPGRKVKFTAPDGSSRELTAKTVILASGSVPTPLKSAPLDGKRIVDSWGALEFAEVPKRLGVIGAGVIGLELGSVWRRLGAQVTVVEFLDKVGAGMDGEVATAFQRGLTKQGMTFRMGTKVTGAKTSKDGVELTLEPAKGGEAETLKGDVVLVAIGRRPYTEGLGLETVGVTPDARGFIANDHFKTSAPGVWVIGDVTHGPMLAHKAEEDAVAVIELIAGKPGHVDYDLVPSVIYTGPEVAWVGKTEEALKAAGVNYKKGKFPFAANSRAKINHETEGFVKVLADAATDKVLGVHIYGPQAGELIGEACMTMAFGGASEDVARTCHPHPTRSEAFRQAAMGVEGWTMQA